MRDTNIFRIASEERDPLEQIGVTGLEHHGGRIHEEFLPQLRGRKAIRTFKEMRDNDPTVGALLFAIDMLIRQVEWRVEPASESESDVAVAEFIDSCFDDMGSTWDDTLSEILSMLWAGFSVCEEVYKQRNGDAPGSLSSKFNDGRIGWRKLSIRAQETIERWIFDEVSQELVGLEQLAPPDWKTRIIPANRFLLFRPKAHKDNPEGRSLLRNAYRPWFYKKRIEEIEGIGIERDLAGLPIAFVPPKLLSPDATAESKSLLGQIERMIRNVRRDEKEGVVFPLSRDENGNLQYDFKLLNAGGRRNFDTNQIVTRYDHRIAQTLLADFILMGQQAVGSFALAESKTSLFAVALGAFLDAIQDVFNNFAIPRLLRLNTLRFETQPVLVHGDIEKIDLTMLGDYVVKLASAGIPIGDPATVRFLRMQAGLPEEVEDDLAVLPPTPPEPGPEPTPAPQPEPTPEPTPGPEPAVNPLEALNGAQVTAALEIAQNVRTGVLPKDSAIALLEAAFNLDPAVARRIIDPIEVRPPAPEPSGNSLPTIPEP